MFYITARYFSKRCKYMNILEIVKPHQHKSWIFLFFFYISVSNDEVSVFVTCKKQMCNNAF